MSKTQVYVSPWPELDSTAAARVIELLAARGRTDTLTPQERAEALQALIRWDEKHRSQFPLQLACPSCSGISGLWVRGRTIKVRALALEVAVMIHGINIRNWDGVNCGNRNQFPYACGCVCAHEFSSHSPAMHTTVFTCTRCGESVARDSSG